MYTPRKHSLAPESVTSASSAGGGYAQKRRRIVQNTPVPEKYLYRHPNSRSSVSRGSSVLGESEARDGPPLGTRDWLESSEMGGQTRSITGEKGKGVDNSGLGNGRRTPRSTLFPESPFARMISRQKQSRGFAATTASQHLSPEGSLRSGYGGAPRFVSSRGMMASSCPSAPSTTRVSDMSPPPFRSSSAFSPQGYSSIQRSTFEFSAPLRKPTPTVTVANPEESKAKTDSLLSFLGTALSRAKSALTEDRELQDQERKRKLKEEARKRAIEEERRRRDEIFAEIAREEEEEEALARQDAERDRQMEREFRPVQAISSQRRQPLTTTTLSQIVSSSTTTVIYGSETSSDLQSEYVGAVSQQHSHISESARPIGAVLAAAESDRVATNGAEKPTVVLNAPAKQLHKPAPPPAAVYQSAAQPSKRQPEVICLDSDDEQEEESQHRYNISLHFGHNSFQSDIYSY